MINTTIRNLLFALIVALIGVACNDSSTSSDSDPAVVEGRVDNTGSSSEKVRTKSVEGAVVTAARVTSSGEIETIGNAEAETNAEGEFTLEIDAEAAVNAADQVVIVAENNGEKAKAFVTAQLESGNTVEVQPITLESTAEAEIYQEIIANGDAGVVSKADIEAAVNGKVAQDINSNSENAADIAAALADWAEAKAEFYSEQGIEITDEQHDKIQEIKTEALLQLESQLNAITDTSEAEAAFNSFLQTVANAETKADIEATAVAKASESSSHIGEPYC